MDAPVTLNPNVAQAVAFFDACIEPERSASWECVRAALFEFAAEAGQLRCQREALDRLVDASHALTIGQGGRGVFESGQHVTDFRTALRAARAAISTRGQTSAPPSSSIVPFETPDRTSAARATEA